MASNSNKKPSILLIITGGIAAYKSLELIRLMRKEGHHVRAILTKGAEHFITPLSVSALCEEPAYTDLWSLKDEAEMGHIRLTREADAIVIAPASANFLARTAYGLADDLATTALLANNDKPVFFAPAMNHKMWSNPATQDNVKTLISRGFIQIGPETGAMACNEQGLGRMSEPDQIFKSIRTHMHQTQDLQGKRVLITAGPTHEPIDPVRFIGNRSSGKQGYALAQELTQRGAQVTLISGPVSLPSPNNIDIHTIQTAQEMHDTVLHLLPDHDAFIGVAAVSDWRAEIPSEQKIKKRADSSPPKLILTENPDILRTVASHKHRPKLVIGFAAETENTLDNAKEKRLRKNCDWIIANDVSGEDASHPAVFGQDHTKIWIIKPDTIEDLPLMTKTQVAQHLTQEIIAFFKSSPQSEAA